MKFKYRKLFNTYIMRRYGFLYLLFRIILFVSWSVFIIAMLAVFGFLNYETVDQRNSALIFGSVYILLVQFIIPEILGRLFLNRYMIAGIGRYLSNQSIKLHLQNESFKIPEMLEDKTSNFKESEHWFLIDDIYIPKELIAAVEINYVKGRHSSSLNYNILFSTGDSAHNIYVEPASCSSKYKTEPITDHIRDHLKSLGYIVVRSYIYKPISCYSKIIKFNLDEYTEKYLNTQELVSHDEESLWNAIES